MKAFKQWDVYDATLRTARPAFVRLPKAVIHTHTQRFSLPLAQEKSANLLVLSPPSPSLSPPLPPRVPTVGPTKCAPHPPLFLLACLSYSPPSSCYLFPFSLFLPTCMRPFLVPPCLSPIDSSVSLTPPAIIVSIQLVLSLPSPLTANPRNPFIFL